MTIKDILGKLESAWEAISDNVPETLRSAAEKMHKTDQALFKAADFLENPIFLSAGAKENFGVSEEKLQEVKADLEHLKEEIANYKPVEESNLVGGMNPALAALLAQLITKVIEKLLERIK